MNLSAPLQPPALVLDTASPTVVAGLLPAGESAETFRWLESGDEAGVGLFRLVDQLLREAGLKVADLRTVAFCEGPGSLLGIRLAAMALRTWVTLAGDRPPTLLAYRSLELAAADLLEAGTEPPFSIVSDARRGTWNLLHIDGPVAAGVLRRWPGAEPFPHEGPVYQLAGFPHWQPLPEGCRSTAYRPRELPRLSRLHPELLRPAGQPDAFLIEAPTYRTWSGAGAAAPAAPGPTTP